MPLSRLFIETKELNDNEKKNEQRISKRAERTKNHEAIQLFVIRIREY